MTLKEVAQRANVSVSTASKALKNSFDVAEETRTRVFAAAHELGYFDQKRRVTVENHGPAGWRVAVLCPEVISPFYSAAVQAICAAAAAHNCQVVIYNIGFNPDEQRRLLRDCVDDPRINAVLALTAQYEPIATDTLPIVMLTEQENPLVSCITIDLDAALQRIRENYPAETRVAIAGEALTLSRQRRLQTFFRADTLVGSGRYEEAGREAAEQLLQRPCLPELVLCTYDEIAYGLIARLTEANVAIPDEVEVIAINDSYSSRWVHGGVSSIAFDYGDVFDQVLRDMVTDLQRAVVLPRNYRISSRFMKRNTTK